MSLNLVGKFFVHDLGEYYKTGKIIAHSTRDQVFLVQYDDMTNDGYPSPFLPFDVGDLSITGPDGDHAWSLFNDEEHREKYLAWRNTPPDGEGAKVLSFKNGGKDKEKKS